MIIITEIKILIDINTLKSKFQVHKLDEHQEGMKLVVTDLGWEDIPVEFVDDPDLIKSQERDLLMKREGLGEQDMQSDITYPPGD
jgi:hypothetical protein